MISYNKIHDLLMAEILYRLLELKLHLRRFLRSASRWFLVGVASYPKGEGKSWVVHLVQLCANCKQ